MTLDPVYIDWTATADAATILAFLVAVLGTIIGVGAWLQWPPDFTASMGPLTWPIAGAFSRGTTPSGRVREWGSIGRNGGVGWRPSSRKGTPGTTTGLAAEAEAPGKDDPRLRRNWEGETPLACKVAGVAKVPGLAKPAGRIPGMPRARRGSPTGHRRSAGLGTPEGPRFRTWV